MNNTIFLASALDAYDKDELGNRIPKHFGNYNNILNNLKKHIKKYDNFLIIASDEINTDLTDMYSIPIIESFKITLPFKKYDILDTRTINNTNELIENADLIYLSGGHVPTENDFFNKINLKSLIQKNTSAVIIGVSAGSMNSADIVYSIPELEGEAIDSNFQKHLSGLGFTNINILPHYNDFIDFTLDGKSLMNDIVIPDSYSNKIYAINDGSYFIIENNKAHLYGNAFIIENGNIKEIGKENESTKIL